MFSLLAVTLLVALFSSTWAATTMLGTPHVVSGVVFDDWNADGMRDGFEPGMSSVLVSLWYLPSGQYSVLSDSSKYVQIGTYLTKIGSDVTQGQFQFTCLAAGTYKVGVHLSSARPGTVSPSSNTSDNDIVSVSGNMGWTAPFQAEEAGSTDLGIGLVQTVFAVAFSMTGDQTVPPTVTNTVGSCYAVLNNTNTSNPEMYFRIVRGPWENNQIEEPGGFFQGWADEAPGFQVRSLADTDEVKENVWFIPRQSFVDDLLNGRMLVQLTASGSFSDKARLRGQFARFRRATYLHTMFSLDGASVVPKVSTGVQGDAMFFVDIMRKQLTYMITYSSLGNEVEIAASLNGPAAVGANGPVVYQLPIGSQKSGVIDGLSDSFIQSLLQSQIYVSIATDVHPNGLLRGQIRAWQQVQYQTVQNLQPQTDVLAAKTYGHAVTQLDLERQTLTYFISYGGLSAPEYTANITQIHTGEWLDLAGDRVPAYQDGVKQGFHYLTQTQINDFLQGNWKYVISSIKGSGAPGTVVQPELQGTIVNWS